jgi:transcription antitermination factor NusG
MFGGYIFVRFDRMADNWRAISRETCDGVIRLMMTRGEIPIPLPAGFVERLKDKEADRLKLPEERLEVFPTGALLVVEEGPFFSFPATCIECDGYNTTARVTIFGREVPLTAPRAWFRAA